MNTKYLPVHIFENITESHAHVNALEQHTVYAFGMQTFLRRVSACKTRQVHSRSTCEERVCVCLRVCKCVSSGCRTIVLLYTCVTEQMLPKYCSHIHDEHVAVIVLHCAVCRKWFARHRTRRAKRTIQIHALHVPPHTPISPIWDSGAQKSRAVNIFPASRVRSRLCQVKRRAFT